MVAAAASTENLNELLDKHAEWLMVAETGRSFPLNRTEIEIETTGNALRFGTVGENGFRSRRIIAFEPEVEEIELVLAAPFGGEAETVRLVPNGFDIARMFSNSSCSSASGLAMVSFFSLCRTKEKAAFRSAPASSERRTIKPIQSGCLRAR